MTNFVILERYFKRLRVFRKSHKILSLSKMEKCLWKGQLVDLDVTERVALETSTVAQWHSGTVAQ